MDSLTLVIGSKNYSSWSLRAWLGLRAQGIPFEEILIPLDTHGTAERIRAQSAAGLVPVLKDGPVTVWESLAILEYAAERFPEKDLWPVDREARALARSVSHEMHAGFAALRETCTMNCRRRYDSFGLDADTRSDVARIVDIWALCRSKYGTGGAFLFGAFSNADAMYAPVESRFVTYGVELDAGARAYTDAVMAHPAMQEWLAAGEDEPVIEKYEC